MVQWKSFLWLFLLISSVSGYKILMLIPMPGPSHFLMFKTFMRELVERGHEVTAITAFEFGEPLVNYTEIYIDPPFPLSEQFRTSELLKSAQASDLDKIRMYHWIGLGSSEWSLENPKVQELIKREDLHFDLILAEQFFQESFLMFAHKFKAPIVTISTYGYSDFFDRIMGSLTPWSFVPHMVILHYGDDMSFFRRCYNFALSALDSAMRKYYYMPRMEEMAKTYFKDLEKNGPLPKVEDLESSISVILVNSHPVMNRPRPLMPGLVNIGGAHIRPNKTLPENIRKFLDEAESGAIYFSLGAYMKSAEMPLATVKTLLKVFGSLKQRVLWKFESDDIPVLPKNVMVQKWMPQNDILAYPSVVLFISHGGLFGTTEGTHYGVPILFMPFFGDQLRNALITESIGYGLKMDYSAITEESLKAKILELINNKKYYRKAKEISRLFRDNPQKPMDEAMYWIEYVARHKGAKHLKSASIKLSWYQNLSLDVLGFFLFLTIFVCWTLKRIAQILIRRVMENFKKNNDKKTN